MTVRRFKLWSPESQVVPNAMVEDAEGEYVLLDEVRAFIAPTLLCRPLLTAEEWRSDNHIAEGMEDYPDM